ERGTVVGVDLTPAMVVVAAGRGPAVLGDARRLPVGAGVADGVLAAGLINHLPDPRAGLRELARVTRPGGRLALFSPVGRATLAARRGHPLRPDDVRDPANLPAALDATGWELVSVDDGPDRYLALARRARRG